MTTPKLYKGDTILINGNPYFVKVGLKPNQIVPDDHVFNVHLVSVNYVPEKHPVNIWSKNINLLPFELV